MNKLGFFMAYNSSVHTNAIWDDVLRKPKIPIDLILSNTEAHDREIIQKELSDENLGTVTVIADHPNLRRPIIPALAEKYLKDLQDRIEDSHR